MPALWAARACIYFARARVRGVVCAAAGHYDVLFSAPSSITSRWALGVAVLRVAPCASERFADLLTR